MRLKLKSVLKFENFGRKIVHNSRTESGRKKFKKKKTEHGPQCDVPLVVKT